MIEDASGFGPDASRRSTISLTRGLTYEPTPQDLELARLAGVPAYGLTYEVTRTDTSFTVAGSMLVPAEVIDQPDGPAMGVAGAAFVVLSGPAGVGKTRLAAEAAATAHERGATAWFEICEPSAVSPLTPLGYWARQVIGGLPDTRAAALRDGPLAPLLEPDVATDRSDVERERAAQFEAVADLFASAGGPSVLILDDAHNIPPDTLACLTHLLRTRPNLRLAIVATVRAAAVPEHTAAAWAALRRLPSVQDDIPISELKPHDAALLFSTVANGEDARPADVQRLVDATGGNPALIMAVAALPDGLTGWPEGTGSETNELLTAAVRTMTEQLDPPARSVLELLAVIASVRPLMTSPTITSAWTRLDEPSVDLASAIETASSIGLLSTDRTSGALLFRHEMLRDVVYGGVGTTRRRELHLAVARSAAEGITGEAVDVDAVAEHYELAWPRCGADEVAVHALRAATHALSLLDVDRAISLARRSLTQLASERSDPASRSHGELLVLLAGALAETGDVKAASDAYRQAADLAQTAGWIDLEAIARTHCLQMRSSRPAPDDPDITGLRRVIDAAPVLDRALIAEGLVYLLAVDPAGSTAPVDAMLAAAEAEGDHHLQLKIIQELTWSTPLDQRARYQAAYAEIASRLGEPGPLARVGLHAWMADIEHGRSRFDLPWEPIGALVREAREPLLTYDWRLWRATVTTNQGRWEEAGRLVEAARTTRFAQPLKGSWLQERPAYISAVHAVQLGSLLYERGEMELLHAVGSQFPIDVLIRCSVDSRSMRARAAAEIGHPSATDLCDELIDESYVDGPKTADWLASMTYLVSACGVCGHRRGAELCLELLEPYRDRHTLVSWTQYIGAVRHNMSFAYALLGDLDAAEDALATPVAQYDAMGAKPFATLGRHHHAQLLDQRGRTADRREAALLKERVLADATELEMTGLLRALTGP